MRWDLARCASCRGVQELAAASMEQNQARAAYAMVVQGAFTAGLERIPEEVGEMADEGERVESVLALIKMWAVRTERAVHEQLQSAKGFAATATMTRAGVSHRRKLQQVAAHRRGLARHGNSPRAGRGLPRDPGTETRTPRPANARAVARERIGRIWQTRCKPAKPKARARPKRRERPDESSQQGNAGVQGGRRGRDHAGVGRERARGGREKIARGLGAPGRRLRRGTAIATVPRDEVWREDMVRLYRCTPVVEKPHAVPVLIAYALVGRFQMIDLEVDRSLVRKLLARGLRRLLRRLGPRRARAALAHHRRLCLGLSRSLRRRAPRALTASDKINMLGICQGGVFADLLRGAVPRKGARTSRFTVTPIDFHGDKRDPQTGSGYMNQWARAMTPKDIDDHGGCAMALRPAASVGFAFLMMNPLLQRHQVHDRAGRRARRRNQAARLPAHGALDRRPSRPSGRSRAPVVQGSLSGQQADQERTDAGRPPSRPGRDITMPVLNIYATGDTIIPRVVLEGHGRKFRHQGLYRGGGARRPYRDLRRRQGAKDARTDTRRVVQGAQRLTCRRARTTLKASLSVGATVRCQACSLGSSASVE